MTQSFKLFNKSVGSEDPWYIKTQIEYEETNTIEYVIDYQRNKMEFIFPICSSKHVVIYDHREKTWKHVNNGDIKQIVSCRIPRVMCKDCNKVTQIIVP